MSKHLRDGWFLFCLLVRSFPHLYDIFLSKAVSEVPTGRGILPVPAAVCRQRVQTPGLS